MFHYNGINQKLREFRTRNLKFHLKKISLDFSHFSETRHISVINFIQTAHGADVCHYSMHYSFHISRKVRSEPSGILAKPKLSKISSRNEVTKVQ